MFRRELVAQIVTICNYIIYFVAIVLQSDIILISQMNDLMCNSLVERKKL